MEEARSIPHSPQVEKAVLSAIFDTPDLIDKADSLTVDHFYLPTNRIVFESILETLKAGKPLELVSFIERLNTTGLLDRAGGPSAVAEVYTYQPTPAYFSSHIEILTEHLARRTAIKTAQELLDAAFIEDLDAVANRAGAVSSAFESVMTCSDTPKTVGALLSDSAAKFEARVTGAENPMGIPTHHLLDQHLYGLHPGRFWIVGAYPGGGKSLLASQIAAEASTNDHPAIFLHLEMTSREVIDRMVIQLSRVDSVAFTNPQAYCETNNLQNLPVGILKAIREAYQKVSRAQITIQRPANRSIRTIIAAIKRAKREKGIKLAVVDYLQLVKGHGQHFSRESEMAQISHELQETAITQGITILALSQLNDEGDTKHGRVIEEDADAVIRIVQDRNKESQTYKQHRHIVIDKDRHYGASGSIVHLILDKETIRFTHGLDQTQKAKPKAGRFD